MTTARPFLLFQDNNAEEAMRLHVSPFDDGKIVEVIHYASGTPGREGSVMKGTFFVAGQTLLCTDSIANTPSRSRPRYRCSSNASRTRSSTSWSPHCPQAARIDAARQLRLQPPLRVGQRPLRRVVATEPGVSRSERSYQCRYTAHNES
ncbi:VOC family protein [Paraburkholderia bengalensis]|uniref:VOC family protein n=1 Tax=Paraburkholderia bengalensis TaxID=2747562 RepID=UPI0030142E32